MKTITVLLLSILVLPIDSLCQKNLEEPAYKIIYSGYMDLSNIKQKIPDMEDVVLRKGDYTVSWYAKASNYKAVNNDTTITIKAKEGRLSPVFKDYKAAQTTFEYNSGMLKEKVNFFSDALNPMEWTITNREKKIDSMRCFKALTIFRGRAYTAWFNPDITLNEGPWKFGGLPGLIIELYDEERVIYWKLKEVHQTDEELPDAPKPRANFAAFKREFNEGYKKVVVASQANDSIDPSCLKCSKQLEVKVQTIENLVE